MGTEADTQMQEVQEERAVRLSQAALRIVGIKEGSKLEIISVGNVVNVTGFNTPEFIGRVHRYDDNAVVRVAARISPNAIEVTRYFTIQDKFVKKSSMKNTYKSGDAEYAELDAFLTEVGQ